MWYAYVLTLFLHCMHLCSYIYTYTHAYCFKNCARYISHLHNIRTLYIQYHLLRRRAAGMQFTMEHFACRCIRRYWVRGGAVLLHTVFSILNKAIFDWIYKNPQELKSKYWLDMKAILLHYQDTPMRELKAYFHWHHFCDPVNS